MDPEKGINLFWVTKQDNNRAETIIWTSWPSACTSHLFWAKIHLLVAATFLGLCSALWNYIKCLVFCFIFHYEIDFEIFEDSNYSPIHLPQGELSLPLDHVYK